MPDDPGDGESETSDSEMSEQDMDASSEEDDAATENAKVSSLRSQFEGDTGAPYKAYTTEFDEIAEAIELCDAEELQRLRRSLDRQLENLHAVVARNPRRGVGGVAFTDSGLIATRQALNSPKLSAL